MNTTDKSLFLASMGVTVFQLWDWMDENGLPDMEATIVHYFDHHYGDQVIN